MYAIDVQLEHQTAPQVSTASTTWGQDDMALFMFS